MIKQPLSSKTLCSNSGDRMKLKLVALSLLVTCLADCKSKSDKVDPKTAPIVTQENKMVTLPSGLKYTVTKPATGDVNPKPGQKVTVHYTGWLDKGNGELGKKFDSSVDRGQQFTFTVGIGQVIKGWDEGLLGMKVGEKRRFIIPAHLAYGFRGAPPSIPSNATLIFDVELFKIG